jgi:hypothetical protein
MKFFNIKRRWLRRVLMAVTAPFYVPRYLYLGLRVMATEFKWCWNLEHPTE